MNEEERERIKTYIEAEAENIEISLNKILREQLRGIGINENDLNALSQAQNTFLKWLTGE